MDPETLGHFIIDMVNRGKPESLPRGRCGITCASEALGTERCTSGSPRGPALGLVTLVVFLRRDGSERQERASHVLSPCPLRGWIKVDGGASPLCILGGSGGRHRLVIGGRREEAKAKGTLVHSRTSTPTNSC